MKRKIRVNAVAPGPVWTPLLSSTFSADMIAKIKDSTKSERVCVCVWGKRAASREGVEVGELCGASRAAAASRKHAPAPPSLPRGAVGRMAQPAEIAPAYVLLASEVRAARGPAGGGGGAARCSPCCGARAAADQQGAHLHPRPRAPAPAPARRTAPT